MTILLFSVHDFVKLALCPPLANLLDEPHLLCMLLSYLICGWDLVAVFHLIV